MDLDNAISAHSQWKTKFRTAIGKHEQLDAATIAKDNCCALGQWLYGEASASLGAKDEYKAVLLKHANFHKEAGKVAVAINAKKFQDAEAMLDANTPYSKISSDVCVAIMQLKKAIG